MGCIAAIALGGMGAMLVAQGPVRIATEAPFFPYVTLGENGQIQGFEREVLDEICARNQWNCVWENAQFSQLLPGLYSGKWDLAVGGIAITDERRKVVDFSNPYGEAGNDSSYWGRPGAPRPEEALIAVQKGTIYDAFMKEQGKEYLSLPTEGDALQSVLSGDADLALGAFPAEQYGDMPGWVDLAPLYSETILDDGTGIALCRGNRALRDPINASLDEMTADGTMDDLRARWF